jgi:CheY-like chemotaxis protein
MESPTTLTKVLIVEDDVLSLLLLGKYLELEGFSVTQAPSHKKALEALSTGSYHVIIADLKLDGEVRGITLLEYCTQTFPLMRRFAITGLPEENIQKLLIEHNPNYSSNNKINNSGGSKHYLWEFIFKKPLHLATITHRLLHTVY